FLGLVQSAYGLTAFDSVIHLIEELPRPQTNGPRVLWLSIVSGTISGMIFMIVCIFCIQNLKGVLDPPSGLPFMELATETVGPQGTVALFAIFVFHGIAQGV